MRSYRAVTAGGVVAGVFGLTALGVTTSVQPDSSARPAGGTMPRGPVAVAAGDSGGVTLYPGLVSVHFDRSYAAMADSSTAADLAQRVKAARSMTAATVQMRAAWRATRYLIRTTPPAPPPADRPRTNGDAAGATAYAAPPETSLQVFTLQHDLVASAAGLLSAQPTLNPRMLRTLRVTATVRDRAIAYIHSVAPPPPPPADRPRTSGAPVSTGFDTVMPGVLPILDDEIATLQGTLSTHKLPATVTSAVRARITQDRATIATINKFWPPLPPED